MAHDRMKNDDVERKMGQPGQDDDLGKQDLGRQTPGRNPNDQQKAEQKGAGQKNQPGGLKDDDLTTGGSPGQRDARTGQE